ncbi:unnamed protein product [Vicia faba]|uniref:RIN4 pathogenic type III effector avirulence factor Avr cleavage site domain-containing protein n=1 Tax=Vicia faba TaxID=3906 RepID=A0AAV0ZF16_VICFA|nr:unnamed protein product [Vicia faba]
MERWEKKPVKMSVPQFGGWENKPKGVPTDYSMVFNQARENKKNHKIDLTEVRRLSGGNDRNAVNNATNYRHRHGHGGGRGHGHDFGPEQTHHHHHHHHATPDPPVMERRNIWSYMSCCIMRPRYDNNF